MQAGERTFLEEGFLLWKAASDMYPIGLQQGDSNMEVNDARTDTDIPRRRILHR
jgi:hypothetical protein